MTYGKLKHLTRALLTGDNVLPKEPEEVLMLLDYAYDRLINEVDVLKLYTSDATHEIVRQGSGDLVLRKPNLPESEDDELDIDHELGFVVGRFIASFISRDKRQEHEYEAKRLSRTYNQKVQRAIEGFEQYGRLEENDPTDQFGKRLFP